MNDIRITNRVRAQRVKVKATPINVMVGDRTAKTKTYRSRSRFVRFGLAMHKYRVATRLLALILVGLILFELVPGLMGAYQARPANYTLNSQAEAIIGKPVNTYADKLRFNNTNLEYEYNKDYKPGSEKTADGLIAGPRFSANFEQEGKKSYTINDVANEVALTFIPEYDTASPQKQNNRLVYPIRGLDAQKVLTLKAALIKEDIILNKFEKDQLEFSYTLGLADGTEARLENDGSVGVYGVEEALLGNVSAATEADQALLDKARQNGQKTRLLFKIPAPFIVEKNKKQSDADSYYRLEGKRLTIVATNLRAGNYPLSIDPSVYIETAAKLMRGNNETNTDFDVSNELIQKSQTTGARIDAWEENQDMNQGTWDNGVTAAGGYIYSVGGRTGTTMPYIVGSQSSTQSSASGSFTMNMPSIRPAGDLYVAMMCRDGTGGTVNAPTGGDWSAITGADTDLDEFGGAWYKIGEDEGGGNEAASYTWNLSTGSEEWNGIIIRIKGFNSGDPLAGTPGTADTTGTPSFPATTPDANATLILRGMGIDDDEPTGTDWVPSGHTKIYSGSSSSGAGSCGFTSAALNVPPASGVSSGSAALTQNTLNDDYGAMSFAINPASVTPANQTGVYWAKFNTTSQAIESPNPGAGTCTDWCTDSDYNLPEARRGFAAVAYNGFLYVIGGSDGTNYESTVLIAKLGANGEPQLWHPTNTDKSTWGYWYQDTGLNGGTARAYLSAVAYNNRMYIVGGDTNTTANSGSSQTVEIADILPNGRLGTWSAGQSLPTTGRYGHSAHIYNDVMYLIGGNNNGTMLNTVYYSKLNSDGTMNSWTATNNFTTARSSHGGTFSTVWGAYIYLAGGCTTVNASGYCTAYTNTTQIASINADGTLAPWGSISNLENQRVGYNLVGWQNALYRVTGCVQQNTSTGECTTTLADVDYGVVNPAGEVSTVSISQPSGSGNCTGGSPYDCNIPDPGDDADEGGELLSMSTVMNGYLYNIGGCVDLNCDGTSDDHGDGDDADASGNTSFTAIDSQGRLTSPTTCAGTRYGSWCIDAINRLYDSQVIYNTGTLTQAGTTVTGAGTTWTAAHVGLVLRYNDGSTALITARASNTSITVNVSKTIGSAQSYAFHDDGLAAAGITVFNNRIYLVGGVNGNDTVESMLYNDLNSDGSLNGAWEYVDMTTVGLASDVSYTYAYARANPASAGSNPGNLFIFGGCGSVGTGLSCGTTDFRTEVYKCNIGTSGAVSSCSTSGQTQIDSDPDTGGSQGLGIHSGTVYANYIYLIGGYSSTEADKDEVIYAKFDDSNNVVESDGSGTAGWTESPNNLSIGRRRGFSFGYNGHIYSVGGYDEGGTVTVLPFIEWAKIDVSTGAIDPFITSSIQITQRWGLSMVVSNSYAYVLGGCDSGGSPDSCASFEPAVQTFQLYNNDSGAINDYTAQGDQTFATDTDRWGASSVVLNGYLYVAGGCISATDCTNATNDVQYASLSATDGTVGTWTNASNDLPADRAWGELVSAGGYLYYLGGQDDTATNEQSSIYYVGSFSSGNISGAWSSIASGGAGNIGDTSTGGVQSAPRTKFGAVVWDNRIYVVGGLDGSAAVTNTVLISPQLNSGGSIAADSWTSDADTFDVARTGMAITAYANNLYIFGGFDGTNYLNDAQFTQINSDGTVDAWTFTTSMPSGLRDAKAVSSNGYIYLIGGRSAASTCLPNTLITPISANTTIATGNNPTGTGEWYETNVRYTGDRYGMAVAYDKGKIYTMGGGCSSPLSSNRHYYSTVKSQPQVAIYSRMIDTDTDVFPTDWLMNGVDNSIGARWQLKYRSMHDLDTLVNPNEDCGTSSSMAQMTTWGQETNVGDVTLGTPGTYTPKESGGGNINCARYFFFYISIDASKTFGYPEDVNRGPTLSDISLFFTADPSKRLRHGKTFTGGQLQPLDTPF